MEFNKGNRILLIDGMGTLYNENFELNKTLLEAINRISAKKILVVNAFSDKARELVSPYNIEVFSFENKIKKEDKEFFLKLLSNFNLTADQVAYLDHGKENIAGALQAGITVSKQFESEKEAEAIEFLHSSISYYEPLKQKNEGFI
jgi:FMN phosphatase YigB (HAD superfamily)